MYEIKWLCIRVTTKLTRVVFSAGYQAYKRHCRRGGAEDDGDVPALEENSEKVKQFGMDAGVFAYDGGASTEFWGHRDFHQDFLEFPIGPTSVEN